MPTILFKDLNKIDYKKAWDFQEDLFRKNVDLKLKSKKKELIANTTNHLLFCEHNPVFTIGKSGDESNLLINSKDLKQEEISFYKTNRGGDITFHGPGQIVGYPILDLECFYTDIHKYMRSLEQVIINTLADFNIKGSRYKGYTGVWLEPDNQKKARKICAIGVRCSRWVTMHGFALNVNTNLNYFNKINPCGIVGKKVSSMESELGNKIDMKEVKVKIKSHFCDVFGITLLNK